MTPLSPAATEESGLPPREQRRPALRSSPCRERPSLTLLLSDLLISGGFGGSECLYSPPSGTTVLLLAHRGSSFTRIIVSSSLLNLPHTLYHEFWFLPLEFFDVLFNHVTPPLFYPFSFPLAKYIRYKFVSLEYKVFCVSTFTLFAPFTSVQPTLLCLLMISITTRVTCSSPCLEKAAFYTIHCLKKNS